MKKEFSYLRRGDQFFPLVPVRLKGPREAITIEALVDSGASFSVFRAEVAEYLGIEIDKGRPIYLTGIGGRILGYLHKVKMSVDQRKFFICKVVFSKELTVSLNILGRDNFFVPFLITFDEKHKKVIVTD